MKCYDLSFETWIHDIRAEAYRDAKEAGGFFMQLRPLPDPTPEQRLEHSRRAGRLFMSMFVRGPRHDSNVWFFRHRQKVLRKMLRITLAASAYRAERGAYPPKPDALLPDYLDELPLDPYTDEPFRYERTDDGFLLYSVGVSRIDHGGSDDDEQGHDDIVIRVPSGVSEGE